MWNSRQQNAVGVWRWWSPVSAIIQIQWLQQSLLKLLFHCQRSQRRGRCGHATTNTCLLWFLLWQHDNNRTTISTITNNGDVVGSLTITVTTMPKQWLWWCWFDNNWKIRNNSQTTVPESKFAHEVVVCCCSCSCFVDLTPSRHQQRIRPDGLGLGSLQKRMAVVRLRA